MAEAEKKIDKSAAAVKDGNAKKEKKKAPKSNKPGFGTRIKRFFKSYKSELSKVVWYSKKQTFKSTGLVIVSLVIVSAVISLLDLGLSNLILWLGSLV